MDLATGILRVLTPLQTLHLLLTVFVAEPLSNIGLLMIRIGCCGSSLFGSFTQEPIRMLAIQASFVGMRTLSPKPLNPKP